MSPNGPSRGGKVTAPSNIYTAILALALGITLATAALVTFLCYTRYGSIFPTTP